MLTIKAPIELKCTGLVLSTGEDFFHRITDSYEMLSAKITGEDLLHLVSTPPELYFAEGGMTNIFSNTNMYQSGESKVEIINNLVNRILVSEEASLTYQDRVYITSMLRKLGITDDRKFMTQVSHMKEEINSRNQLIDLYWNHSNELRQLVEEYQSYEENRHEEHSSGKQEWYLHEEILNRLQTGAIYQLVQNFSTRRPGSIQITEQELQIAEQGRTANTILLQKLQSLVRGEEVPLVYRHENYYEQSEFSEENVTKEEVTKQLVSAVLLNLADNLYESRYHSYAEKQDNWYHMEYGLYRTAENTIQRFKSRIDRSISERKTQENHLTLENQSHFYNQETYLLKQLFDEELQEENQYIQNRYRQQNENRITKEYTQQESTVVREDGQSVPQQEPEELVQERSVEEISRLTEENLSSIEEQLNQINLRNEENYRRYHEILRTEEQKHQRHLTAEERRERMKKEGLQALSDPQKLLLSYREEAQRQEEQEKKLSEQIGSQVMPKESRQIFELVEQYIKQPAVWQKGEEMTSGSLGMLKRDIEQVNMTVVEQQKVNEERERVVREVAEAVTERPEIENADRSTRQYRKESRQNLSFVHREQNNTTEEEIMQQLLEQNRLLQQKNIVTEQTMQTTQVINEHQNWQQIRNVQQNNEDVANLIRSDVQRQLGAISDQVYAKLEKRLQNEKKRRGY